MGCAVPRIGGRACTRSLRSRGRCHHHQWNHCSKFRGQGKRGSGGIVLVSVQTPLGELWLKEALTERPLCNLIVTRLMAACCWLILEVRKQDSGRGAI